MILGIDEVGRGAWAGPLVVGACVLPDKVNISGLTDSKKLTKKQREKVEPIIKKSALAFGLGWVSAREIDQIGLAQALTLATHRAVSEIKPGFYDRIIIDGTVDFLHSDMVTVMKQADLIVPAVSAASILAKVARDKMMAELDNNEVYSKYQFSRHVGYGTRLHREALEVYGVSDLHRLSFRPLAEINQTYVKPTANFSGSLGEEVALSWLERSGYEILAKNWRTKYFEVDLVVKKDDLVGLIEVKTRSSDYFGGGVAAINQSKLKHLQRASQVILQKPKFDNCRVAIGVLSVYYNKSDFTVDELLWLES